MKTKQLRKVWDAEVGSLFDVAVWLWENRAKLVARADKMAEDTPYADVFDYPDYSGMPKRLWKKLTSDDVDNIQNGFDYILTAKTFGVVVRVVTRRLL